MTLCYKHWKAKTLCCLLAVVLLYCTIPQMNVMAATTVSVTPVHKAFSNWCWAACAEMAGKNVYPSSWCDQYTVVSLIKGSGNPNVGGTAYETASGCTIVANSTKNYIVYNSTFSQPQIKNYINSGYALVAITGNAYGTLPLHDIVIYGYDAVGSTDYIYIIDPDTGLPASVTRSSLISGSWKSGYFLPYFATIYPN